MRADLKCCVVPCQYIGMSRCGICLRRVCDDHAKAVEGGRRCPACAQQVKP